MKLKGGVFPLLLKFLFYSIRDYFSKNYGYHSSALTFFLLLSIFPLFIFLLSVFSLLAFFNISYVYYILYNLFPSFAKDILDNVLKFYNTEVSINLSFFSIFISLYFSKDLFIAIQMAFSYVWETEYKGNRQNLIVAVLSLPVLALIFTGIYIFMLLLKFIQEIKHFLESLDIFFLNWLLEIINFLNKNIKLLSYSSNVLKVFIIWFFVFLLFYYFTPKKVFKRDVLVTSLIFTFFLLVLEFLFKILLLNFLSKNPLFLTLGSIFVFIMWAKFSFDIILIGERFLYYLSNKAEGKNLPQ
ncbi:MAG: YhjD/YihY/BrkB family envelope integrity protein [Sulfurihydrogenibium sp.]|uniref:YhjD/YihY/BrkB family envelope integrity protein n=1 Tax=Sulfurihydrogenibium sp. TaxID=2053621 RepID=UPI003C7C04FA